MSYSFDAVYDAAAAAQAERAFYVRSIWELRRLMTFAPPVVFSVAVAAGLALGSSTWFVIFMSAMLGCSVLGPIFFYFARPLGARRWALEHPIRRINLTPEEIQVSSGQRTDNIPWRHVKHVWDAGDYVLLVFGPFATFGLPKGSLPEGANDFIRACVQKAPS